MGILSAWRLANGGQRVDGISSPYTTNQLNGIVLGDIFKGVEFPLTREEAIQVPAVSKARNLLAPLIGRQPLVALDASGVLPPARQPSFLYRSDSPIISPALMWTWVVDDLIFRGSSLLGVKRGTDGFPLSLERIDPSRWTITNGAILVDEKPVTEGAGGTVIYVPGFVDALLDVGSRTIRQSRDIEDAVAGRARNPIPTTVIRQTEDNADLEQDEVKAIVEAYTRNRRDPDGTVAFLPYGLEMDVLGESEPSMFENARNFSRIDVGSFLGVPSSMMDATTVQASLTYENKAGERSRFYVEALPLFSGPIEHRLSLDDVVPRGQRVRFDFTELYAASPTATDAPVQD